MEATCSRAGPVEWRPRLALAVATGAASVLPSFLVGALALQIRDDLDVGVEAVAAGVTVFFLAGALGAGWGGRLADHIGALRAMRRCILVTAAALGAAALAPLLPLLFVLLAVAGVANAVTQPAINLFVAEQIPADRQGLGFGIKQSGIPAAILVSGLALPVLALPLGWRVTLAICALAPLAVGLVLPRGEAVHVSRRPASRRPSRAPLLTAFAPRSNGGSRVRWAPIRGPRGERGDRRGHAGLLAEAASGPASARGARARAPPPPRLWARARGDFSPRAEWGSRYVEPTRPASCSARSWRSRWVEMARLFDLASWMRTGRRPEARPG